MSWANIGDVAWMTAAAAGLVKLLDVIFGYLRDRSKHRMEEGVADDAAENKFRSDLIGRISALETSERAERGRVLVLERKLTRVIGMLVVFRLCQEPQCPIVDSLRKSGDLGWLDQELIDRNGGEKT